MQAVIIAVGSELLGADRADTNSLALADVLLSHGVEVTRKVIVGDTSSDLAREVERASTDADLVLMTGGLGPTQDDLTREVVAGALGRELVRDPSIIDDIREKFASFGRTMPEVNVKQADVIGGAEVLYNARGTAPGLRVLTEAATFFLFPGVPHELEGLIETALVPWLARTTSGNRVERRVFKVACVPESELEELIGPFYERFGPDGVSILPTPGVINVRLTHRGSRDENRVWFAPRQDLIRELLGVRVFGEDENGTLESAVGELLETSESTLVTAESCTGGGIAERLTRTPGSSAYFLGSVVTYSNKLKTAVLGIPDEVLERHGAVSEAVAVAMAAEARERLGADYALAVTGIAGPGGGTDEKPVGTVHVAVGGPDAARSRHRRFQFPGDRTRVRLLTVNWALDMLRLCLLEG